MRAYLAGAMWDEGYTEIAGHAISIADSLLGSTAEKGEASKLRLITIDEGFTGGTIDEQSQLAKKYTRIKFITLDKRKISYVKLMTSRVILDVRHGIGLKDYEKRFAVGALLTALMLSGLGKVSRRGFGTFSFTIEMDQTGTFAEIFRNYSAKNIEGILRNLIKTTYNSTKKLIEKHESRGEKAQIPPIPSITLLKMANENPIFELIVAKGKSVDESIQAINDFCTRPKRLIRMGMSFKSTDNITRERVAWVLGLPRKQRGTGYFTSVERRASPFIFAAHTNWLSASIFISGDWPPEITWKGRRYTKKIPITRDQANLLRAYSIVKRELWNYLTRLGFQMLRVIPWK